MTDSISTAKAAALPRRPGATLRHRMTRTLQFIVMVFVVNFFVLPQLKGVRNAVRELRDVRTSFLVLGFVLEGLALLCYARLTKAALAPTHLRVRTLFRIQLATKALTNVVPGGSAAGPALGYRLLVLGGEERATAGFALALVGLGSAVLLNLILWLTFLVSIPLNGVRPGYVTVALVGVVVLAAFAGLVFAAIRGADRAERIVRRLAIRFRFLNEERSGAFVQRFATRVRGLVSDRRVVRSLLLWGSLNWLLDASALWVILKAFGLTLRPDLVIVAFCVANITAAIPLTPGGLGLYEGALGTALGLFGVPIAPGALAISAYRLAAFWLPIPLGGLSWLSLRAGRWSISRTAHLGRLRDEAGGVLESGETVYDWADRVAVPRVAAAASAAAQQGDVVILADRAEPGTVRQGRLRTPPPNAPQPGATSAGVTSEELPTPEF